MSHKRKTQNFNILVQSIVDAFHMGDHINPAYRDGRDNLHRRYEGRYFGSDFIKEMHELQRDTDYIDPHFREEVYAIAEKIVEKEIEAIRVVSEIEREMLKAEAEIIRMEAEASIQAAYCRAIEKMEKDLFAIRQRAAARLADLDFSGLDQDVRDLKRDTCEAQRKMHEEFRLASVLPSGERFQTCRRHMGRVREIIKSFVYEP